MTWQTVDCRPFWLCVLLSVTATVAYSIVRKRKFYSSTLVLYVFTGPYLSTGYWPSFALGVLQYTYHRVDS